MGNGIRRKDQKHTVRDSPDLMWHDANINVYGFEDINQIALDNRYGKVAAPLSKRVMEPVQQAEMHNLGYLDGMILSLNNLHGLSPLLLL